LYALTNTNTDFTLESYYWIGNSLAITAVVLNFATLLYILYNNWDPKIHILNSWTSLIIIIAIFATVLAKSYKKEFNYYESETIIVLNKTINTIENTTTIQLNIGYFNYEIYNITYNCSINDNSCIDMYNLSDPYTINNMSYANYIPNYNQLYVLSNEYTNYGFNKSSLCGEIIFGFAFTTIISIIMLTSICVLYMRIVYASQIK